MFFPNLWVAKKVCNLVNMAIGNLQQGTNENSTISDGLISPSTTIPGADPPAAAEVKEEMDMVSTVRRRKGFIQMERVNGKPTNVLQGLEIYNGVFNPEEQKKIVEVVYELQEKGKNGQFEATRTYSETARWLLGKGGSTMQFGSNYAEDRRGNPPGRLTNERVDHIPPLLEAMIQKLIDCNILHADCRPDNCVVNIYNIGDCLPPETYHTDFHRPTCTVSLVTECNILFGANTKKNGTEISAAPVLLPAGSVLILKGNAANVAKQCVPRMTCRRISITFRKMDESKLPLEKNTRDSIMSDNGAEVGEDSDEKLSTEKDDSPLSSNTSSNSLSSACP